MKSRIAISVVFVLMAAAAFAADAATAHSVRRAKIFRQNKKSCRYLGRRCFNRSEDGGDGGQHAHASLAARDLAGKRAGA